MKRMDAKAEQIIVYGESMVIEESDIDWNELDLGEIELDKASVQNIRRKSDLVAYLINKDSKVYYNFIPRQKHEVFGGYKKSLQKGARLNECQVYNLYFRFKSPWLDGTSIALMCRPPHRRGEEWVFLLPDDTMGRIKAERKMYLRDARELTLYRQLMDPDEQNKLIENLALLDLHERCAQTLIHEYGHVLHYRMFDELNLHNNSDRYKWFLYSGYLDLVDLRYNDFASLEPLDKLTELKESLVEDYRISLNLQANNGMFILPNKVCYFGDFQLPELMYKGVEVMKEMLKGAIGGQAGKRAGGQSAHELDTLAYGRKLRRRMAASDWAAGKPSMTPDVIQRDLAILAMLDTEEEAATTLQVM
ncbi:hypothetical protein ACFQI7_27380 [Paenibacillus allorhizosphaerae]|uniref:Uncharacterized protein n=1 Tax=Paenibacillus allorhizosphaerae TaxID=2849866 RepID=A0ABM8VNG6_9BACL|nr:hypothetical protein [Paenibacillus allorhizosphaerae]CAG7651375.1 hypothetical protein PAECIP111802_04947 [Paenibacillus allorhizosphaerae]